MKFFSRSVLLGYIEYYQLLDGKKCSNCVSPYRRKCFFRYYSALCLSYLNNLMIQHIFSFACAIVFPILVLKWLDMVMTLENIEILPLHCRNNTIS